MPAACLARRLLNCRVVPVAVLFALCAAFTPNESLAQNPKAPTETRAGAIKLPDGTIVFFTKNPDDPNPPVDGVILSGKEYKALIEQAEAGKKGKEPAKPQSPSGCAIRAKVQQVGDTQVATLTLNYTVQTTAPRTVINLGCGRGFPRAARLADGKLPVIGSTAEGLTAVLEKVGENTLTVELDAPITPRGSKGELGFDIGLPRAAITTFSLESPPNGVKKVSVGTRTADRPTEIQRSSFAVERLTDASGQPLGPTDTLEVTWDAPTTTTPAPPADTSLVAESEIAVRVDESQVETTTKIRLRGPTREWQIALPPGADVTAARTTPDSSVPGGAGTLVRPPDSNKPIWTVKLPEGPAVEWTVTATVRVSRPKSNDPRFRGPYPIGPVQVLNATRQTATLRVTAPPTVRVRFRHGPQIRLQNIPVGTDEELVGLFKTTFATQANKNYPSPYLELDATLARVFVRVEPTYRLKRTEAGWRLDSSLKVTPVRADVEQLIVEVPEGWPAIEAGPPDVVDEVQEQKEGKLRLLTIRLATPQRSALTLTLTGTFPVPAGAKAAVVGLPRFPQAIEQNAKVTASVPDGLEIRGTVFAWENGQATGATDLKPDSGEPKPGAGVASASAQLEKGAGQVELAWQSHQPELDAEVRADITIQDRQAVVMQSIRFRSPDGGSRPIRLKGPSGVTGLRGNADPVGPNEWVFRPPADAGKDFTLSLSYGLAIPTRRPTDAGGQLCPIGLIWPESATRVTSTARVWSAPGSRRITKFDGPWRELPAEAERDVLPVLTLAGSGSGLPLNLELGAVSEDTLPQVLVDRAIIQTWTADNQIAMKTRFVLRRWTTSRLEVSLPPGVVPEILLDGQKVSDVSLVPGTTTVGVPLGEPRPGRTHVILEVRYQLTVPRSAWTDFVLTPPVLMGAAYRIPARWYMTFPNEVTPLIWGEEFQAEGRWTLRSGLVIPTATSNHQDLEQWFAAGIEGEGTLDPNSTPSVGIGEPILGRQSMPNHLSVVTLPRTGWILSCSFAIVIVGVGLARLQPIAIGPVVAILGTLVAVAAITWPHPASQVVVGCQPGLCVVVILLTAQVGVRWYYRRRVTHLPGFTRTRRDPIHNGTGTNPAVGQTAPVSGSASTPRLVEDQPPASARR